MYSLQIAEFCLVHDAHTAEIAYQTLVARSAMGVLVLVLGDATIHTDVFISAYGYYWTYHHIV